jgi:hypothetical protein
MSGYLESGPVIVAPQTNQQYGWTLQGAEYTELDGFRITGDGVSQVNGLLVDVSLDVTIKNCEVDNTIYGIHTKSSSLIVDTCLVHDTTTAGIRLESTTDADLQVTNLTLTSTGQYGVYAESCQLLFDSTNIINWNISGSDHVLAASGCNLTLDGITISGGATAGVTAHNAILTVQNATLQNNGYGIAAETSTVIVENSTMSQNTVGLYSNQDTLTVRDSAI